MIYYRCKFLLEDKTTFSIVPAEDHISLMEILSKHEGTLLGFSVIPKRVFKMSVQDSLFFFTYFREFLNADISLVEALDTVIEETRKTNIKAIATKLRHDVSSGLLLSDAMHSQSNVFSPITISLITASERINTLSSACNYITNYLTFNQQITKKIKSVITYPIFMFAMIFGMIVFYSKVVIPKLSSIFTEFSGENGGGMPIQTELLVSFSSFISHYWLIMIASLIATPIGILALYKKSPSFKYQYDSLILHIPLVSSFVIKSQLSRFAIFTSNMYERGYNFLDSITEATVVITNERIKNDINTAIEAIYSGEAVHKALRQIPYVPRFVHRMFRVAEITSNVVRPLTSVYEFYTQEIKNDLEKILSIVKPLSIIIIGLLMFWIISATLLPFYSRLPTLLGANV